MDETFADPESSENVTPIYSWQKPGDFKMFKEEGMAVLDAIIAPLDSAAADSILSTTRTLVGPGKHSLESVLPILKKLVNRLPHLGNSAITNTEKPHE